MIGQRLLQWVIGFALLSDPASAEQTLRIATYNTELDRAGPGLLLRDILRGDDPQINAVAKSISHIAPDIIVLQRFDFDHELHALQAFSDTLSANGMTYPHIFARRPNTGLQTGLDLNENGRLGEAQDAHGYGEFSGQRGMAILSKFPIDRTHVRDFSALTLGEIPLRQRVGITSVLRRYDFLRMSSVGHWDVPLILPNGTRLHLLTWHGSSPVFDGPEDRNGRRGAAETLFWADYLNGLLIQPPPSDPVIVVGVANIDPVDGEGRHGALLHGQTLVDMRGV